MFVANERFLSEIVKKYGQHTISYSGNWYPQSCQFLKPVYHLHSHYEKSIIIEITMQYIKYKTKNFDDYFPCRKKNCKLKHVKNWLKLFAHFYNLEIIS